MRDRLTAIMAIAAIGFAGAGAAQAASIDGTWSGAGKVTMKDGVVEPVRCRIRYEPGSGRTFLVHANCAHANGIFQQSGRVVQRSATSYTGHIYSDQFGVAGDVTIAVSGNSQTLTAVSAKGRASVRLLRK
jgi:hypothetical protein